MHLFSLYDLADLRLLGGVKLREVHGLVSGTVVSTVNVKQEARVST
jgi:hypothetical protein